MSNPYPIVVYGANGYTGKLIAEYLAKKQLPFVAAGRNKERLEQAMMEVPGDPRVEIQAVEHTEEALTRLFTGTQVVINVVGPFGQLGYETARASLRAGCHYIDTTGEPDFVLKVRDELGEAYAAKGLLCSPACSWMWAAGALAAELALEQPGIDALDLLYTPNGAPTIASTLSFLRMVCRDQYYLQANQLVSWPPATVVDVAIPGKHTVQAGLPWGGGMEPIWYQDDDRVRDCSVLVSFPKQHPLVGFLSERMQEFQEKAQTMTDAELEALTNAWGNAIAQTPPREIQEINRCIVSCWGRGTMNGTQVILYGTSPYLQTGALCAEASERILNGRLKATGFASPTRAFGARELIAALAEQGLHCWQS